MQEQLGRISPPSEQCVIYARAHGVNPADAQATIGRQQLAAQQYAHDGGWQVVEVFVDGEASSMTSHQRRQK